MSRSPRLAIECALAAAAAAAAADDGSTLEMEDSAIDEGVGWVSSSGWRDMTALMAARSWEVYSDHGRDLRKARTPSRSEEE